MNHLNYGVFVDTTAAQQARDAVLEEFPSEVRLVEQGDHVYNEELPISGTLAVRGSIFGALLVAVIVAAVVGVAFWAGIGTGELLSPGWGIAIAAVAATVFGGIAGALAFSTSNRPRLRQLDRHVRLGRRLVIVQSERDMSDFLLRRGAIEAGTIA